MDLLRRYRMFVQVAASGSFNGAARALGVPPQTATRAIAELERHLAVPLFHRTTRAVTLTHEGDALLPAAQRLLDQAAELDRLAGGERGEPAGVLHVTAPVQFGRRHVLPVVTRLLAAHPALDVRLLLLDRTINLTEEGIDLAVRIGPLPDSALRAVRLGEVRPMLVASPAYAGRHGLPDSVDALPGHAFIATTGARATAEWRFAPPAARPRRARLRVNSVEAARDAALAGVGIAAFLDYQVADALADGRLLPVLDPLPVPPLPVHAVFEAQRTESLALRALLTQLRHACAAALPATEPASRPG